MKSTPSAAGRHSMATRSYRLAGLVKKVERQRVNDDPPAESIHRTLPQHLVASPENKAKDFQSCNSDIYFDRVKGKTGECFGVSHPIVPKVFHSFFLSFFPFHSFILLPFQKLSWYHTQTARKGRFKIEKNYLKTENSFTSVLQFIKSYGEATSQQIAFFLFFFSFFLSSFSVSHASPLLIRWH